MQQAKDLPQQTDIARFDVVFCSDLQRAFNSAELAFGNNIRIIQDSRLRECNYGTYDGKPTDIVEPLQEANITTRFPEGESYEDVKTRIAAFLDDVKKNYDGKHIAIV
ncbi:MAG: histidine phosphatase family protein [bacterium]